ncbi:ABC transporter ATP-binding protein [Spiribacter halobius]|uniref:Histidine/lysine/arginine/ornithine ABC transporter ATP-binding protein n=1 Tax=Sediminicurvatus halobius TaxID=2182432 RepID=A0A2U2MXV4_9GAMM|nr:ATP-binding cassette domain-containing protein [Spiribacter halobius]PWG61657.1 histidine/lysine/arginine/ornithine ABC transporter ATP-binding protein [Spiribacter halobius]UEX79445.1 ATP-binding cassette domain-containing protein [Spiribacter halobius]
MSTAALELHNIHKRFGELEVLRGIDLTAMRGDVIALIGASGSGKSTLLRCINLLEPPNEGRILFDGEELALRRSREGTLVAADSRQITRLRAGVGFVFQNFNLWPHMSILQNVIEAPMQVLGRSRREAVAEAEALLEKVGLADKRDSYPAFLSGGQQQRAAIARTLAMHPKVILFDEPTSALDPELVGEVLGVIRQLAEEGRTMLIVTHEMRFAQEVASQVVFLHEGRIEEQGPPEAVFGAPRSERCRAFLANHLAVSAATG